MAGPRGFSWRLLVSVLLIFLLLHVSATALGSLRGEAGILVGVLVVVSCLVAQRIVWNRSPRIGSVALGLGRPIARGLGAGVAISLLLVLVLALFLSLTDTRVTMYPGWVWLLPGLFAQGGVAEEVLFRGYLFGTLRRSHAFWRAAVLSTGPFIAAHLLLFATMSWPVALAATVLACIVSFPLPHLFELGGRTIWAPALVHFSMQSALKVVELSGPSAPVAPLVWMAACAIVPWLVFAIRVPSPDPVPVRVA